MLSTSHSTATVTGGAAAERGTAMNVAWLRHVLFAAGYTVMVLASITVAYSGTSIAIVWPSAGVAVWWAIICLGWRSFACMSAFVFAVPALYLSVVDGQALLPVFFVALSHVIAGPVVGLVLILLEKMFPPRSHFQGGDDRVSARIVLPRHVYRLLLVSLVMIPVARAVGLVGLAMETAVSLELYMGLVLRDVAGVLAVAGPGIAISSAVGQKISGAAFREFAGVTVVTAVLLALIFGPGQDLPIAYLAMLPLYWSATRLPVAVAAVHNVVTVVATMLLSYLVGTGPFAVSDDSVLDQASATQIFIIMCVVLSLVVSTTVQQHATLVAELAALTETIPDALLLIDRQGKAIPINADAHDVVFERDDGEILARPLREVDGDLIDETDNPGTVALRGENVREMLVELDHSSADGTDRDRRFYSVRSSPLYLPGEVEPGHAVLLYHDSTDEYWRMRQLRRARDEARALFEYAPQGVATLDDDGVILQANRALGELVGAPVDQLVGRRLDEFSRDGAFTGEIEAALADPGTLVQTDRGFESADGWEKRVTLSFRTIAGGDSGATALLVNVVDVTHQHEFYELVSHIADHDALTGLINRRRLDADLADILKDGGTEQETGAVLLIDLDRFKAVNDTLGHHVGDDLLVEFATLLQECVRATDRVARLGGDEFVVVLPDADRAEAAVIGERILAAANRRFRGRTGVLGEVTASIGAAMFSEAKGSPTDLLVLADQRLYDAKKSGRNRVAAAPLGRGQVQRILQTGSVRLELQPIADMKTGQITWAEGLMRVAPDEGEVCTGEFVAAVEKTGWGPKLDALIMRRGIGLLPQLQRARPGFRLSLNLSAQSLGSEEVAQVIIEELRRHRVPAGSLVLEVTETTPLRDVDAARAFQRTLREHGVVFALDDFGAGFDPYRYLKCLDFDVVKIAGEFVESMTDGGVDLSVVKSLVRLAEDEGMETVAEYVSAEQIFEAARRLGVTYGQGYHFGASLPPREFITEHLTGAGAGAPVADEKG